MLLDSKLLKISKVDKIKPSHSKAYKWVACYEGLIQMIYYHADTSKKYFYLLCN